MSTLPHVSLIMLNWNGRQFLAQSLPSLLALDYPDFSVLVIDNASTDGSVAFVRQEFPRVEVHCNTRNLGFAAGNNVGLRRVQANIAVLLNPDIVVSRDWLRELVAPMLEDETIGIAGCKIYYPGGRRLQHAGGYVSYPRAVPGHYGLNETDCGQYDIVRDVDYVIGAALALRRDVLSKVGLLDEGFFLYFEDADLCTRARRAGYRVVYVPKATLVHVESALTEKGSDAYLRHMHTSRWRFLLKHYDLDGVLQDTVPSELAWMDGRTLRERRAAARAYWSTLKSLPAIWSARARDGGPRMGQVTEEQNREIAEKLRALRHAAWKPGEPAPTSGSEDQPTSVSAAPRRASDQADRPHPADKPHPLEEKWQIQERPFVSHVPLIGPLIARLREAWNRISTKWYVLPLVQQQNEFNWLVMRRFRELERLEARFEKVQSLVGELDERVLVEDSEAMELAREVGELTYAVVRLEKRLSELTSRLERVMASSEQES